VAINKNVSELHTLYADLLCEPSVEYMQLHHGIRIIQPSSQQEASYTDDELETSYQRALAAFSHASVDSLKKIHDPRTRITIAD
jgi:hypothetical protein